MSFDSTLKLLIYTPKESSFLYPKWKSIKMRKSHTQNPFLYRSEQTPTIVSAQTNVGQKFYGNFLFLIRKNWDGNLHIITTVRGKLKVLLSPFKKTIFLLYRNPKNVFEVRLCDNLHNFLS